MTLLGHNGAGKSTVIKYLLGFYPSINSHPYLKNFSEFFPSFNLSSVGYAPDAALLSENATAKEYINLISSLKNRTTDREQLLQKVSLDVDHKLPIKKYSKGMKQKLLLALALIGNPKTLILDEPTSGLDPFMTKEIESMLLDLNKNHTIIISTHSLELATKLQNEIWILSRGELFFRGFLESRELIEKKLFESVQR